MILFVRSFLRRIATDNISFLAGGVAFYGLLSIFPAIAAIVALFGLWTDPHVVREQLEHAKDLFPADVFNLINEQILILVEQPPSTLSLTALASLILAISAATRGTKAMLAALNTVFRIQESRGWWKRQILSYVLTLGGISILILAIVLVIAVPLIVQFISPDIAMMIAKPIAYLRWVILSAAVWGGILFLLLIGPDRDIADQYIMGNLFGATAATLLWLGSAVGLSWFVQTIPNFQSAYGPLSAVIVLMLWTVLSAYAVLIGAALTATFDKEPNTLMADPRD